MDNPFPQNSRYANLAVLTRTGPDGAPQYSLARRILPAPERFVPLDRVRLSGDERPDTLAYAAYGDPALWWRIADAAGEPDPAGLSGPEGRLLTIPLPLEVADNGSA
ncbi:LysM domain-containing protein [Pseudogemmobacter bohemicus]|uniref:LysM domain-containing protein n=1 Tax=Pseudogemmobacter bohemicus TaxID=2250708 RepID=UPI000DD48F4E|nr:LysM domain-containing protein [Pseudogemmobacter bohemicus]